MKRFRIWILAALAAALCLLCGCSAEDFALPRDIQLAVGQQCALTEEVRYTGKLSDITPQDMQEFAQAAENAVVHIASTDPDVAAVDQEGNVTAVAPGTATILVSCVDFDFYAEVNVQVAEPQATPESAAPATPETATPESAAAPETATPETATPESAATPETAADAGSTATPETATPQAATPETAEPATPESAAPATPESAATPETATPETAAREGTATPESAAAAESAAATPETALAPKATPEPEPTQDETVQAEEKPKEPFREFLKKAGSTVADFFAGLFEGKKANE